MDGSITEYNSEKKKKTNPKTSPLLPVFTVLSLLPPLASLDSFLPLPTLPPPYPHPTPPPPYEDATGAPREKVTESVIK